MFSSKRALSVGAGHGELWSLMESAHRPRMCWCRPSPCWAVGWVAVQGVAMKTGWCSPCCFPSHPLLWYALFRQIVSHPKHSGFSPMIRGNCHVGGPHMAGLLPQSQPMGLLAALMPPALSNTTYRRMLARSIISPTFRQKTF